MSKILLTRVPERMGAYVYTHRNEICKWQSNGSFFLEFSKFFESPLGSFIIVLFLGHFFIYCASFRKHFLKILSCHFLIRLPMFPLFVHTCLCLRVLGRLVGLFDLRLLYILVNICQRLESMSDH